MKLQLHVGPNVYVKHCTNALTNVWYFLFCQSFIIDSSSQVFYNWLWYGCTISALDIFCQKDRKIDDGAPILQGWIQSNICTCRRPKLYNAIILTRCKFLLEFSFYPKVLCWVLIWAGLGWFGLINKQCHFIKKAQ